VIRARAVDAFLQERRRCDKLDGGVDGDRLWMSFDRSAKRADGTGVRRLR
jgi:hypothetical protein